MKKDLLSIQFLKGSTAWIFLLIGVFFYYLGYFEIKEAGVFKEIVLKIGDILVIGVILGYLTNVSQLLGVFKSDLEDIIYSKDFVKRRNDLPLIWENVTKELFKSKFPSISKDLLNIIRTSYLPVDNVSYYNDYNISIDIDWADYDKKIILTKSVLSFDLIAEDKTKFEFPLKSWINVEGLEKSDYHVKVSEYLVNNKEPKNVRYKESVINNIHEYVCTIDLEGELKYDISKKIEKKYSFNKDFDISFRAQFIINRLNVRIRHPKNIRANFISRGTVENFKEVNCTCDSLEMKYKGILLPNQGYVIALKEIDCD